MQKETTEIKLPSSSDRILSLNMDKIREGSSRKANEQLSEIQKQLKLFLSTPERSGAQATQLEERLGGIAQHFKGDSAFGSHDGNFPSQFEEFAKAFQKYREGKTTPDNLQEKWQSVTQELRRVSGLPEIPSIATLNMTLEEKIEKLLQLRRGGR